MSPMLAFDGSSERSRRPRHEERILNLIVARDAALLDRPADPFKAGLGKLPQRLTLPFAIMRDEIGQLELGIRRDEARRPPAGTGAAERALEEHHVEPAIHEHVGAGQAAQAAPDDHDVRAGISCQRRNLWRGLVVPVDRLLHKPRRVPNAASST